MDIACIGGGPAGLFFAIMARKHDPEHAVTVFERNPRGNTFGWGIVFSDGSMEALEGADAEVARAVRDSLAHWDDIEVRIRGSVVRSGGHGFSGVGRHRFLEILQHRAEALGVTLCYDHGVDDPAALEGFDLVVAADGVGSAVRSARAERFEPEIEMQHNRFTWLGTHQTFPAFTFAFEPTEWGWFQAHAYRFEPGTSTFIVECTDETWRAAGLDRMEKAEAIEFCERLFAAHLDGHALLDNSPHLPGPDMWRRFPLVRNARWHDGRVVLLGDAAATAHFSIGSGTKLAVESAIALADALHAGHANLGEALDAYEDARRIEVLRLQNAARNSTRWFENVALRADLDVEQFAYSLLTRSQRVSHENLRLRDSAYVERYERGLERRLTGDAPGQARPPMFVPFRLKGLRLPNRIGVSPMAMYRAEEGQVTDFHLVHLGARAMGGAGLVFSEMTCPSPDARITRGCAGLWTDAQRDAYARIVDYVHAETPAAVALQLGHAGRKGAVTRPWEGDPPRRDGWPLPDGWPLLAPSPIPWQDEYAVPRAMTRDDMERVRDSFQAAARRGADAGFDLLELHCAHGYLLSSFLSPLTNQRDDEWGGSTENRLRFPLEVFAAMRDVWPADRPLSVRLSASDWAEGGVDVDEAVALARALGQAGADVIDVSAGQVVPYQQPVYGRMFQTPFAERIRLETGLPVMAVGNLYEPDHANGIIASGRADLCLLARPHLSDPNWTQHAAAALGYEDQWWTPSYLPGKWQAERLAERDRA